MSDANDHGGGSGEEFLALHDELDALTGEKDSLAAITVFGFAAVLFFLLGLDMGSWKVIAGALASGLVAAGYVRRDLMRRFRKRELRAELEARRAWVPVEGEGPGGGGEGSRLLGG